MPENIERLTKALRAAHEAGDTASAQRLAEMIRSARGDPRLPKVVPTDTTVADEGAGTALRSAEFFSRGFLDRASDVVGSIPEAVAGGLRSVGLPAPDEGYYPEAIKQGLSQFGQAVSTPLNVAVEFGPDAPQSATEQFAGGAGRGAADAAAFMSPFAIASKVAQPGQLISRVAGAVKHQPVVQAAAGGAAGGTTDVTESELSGMTAGTAYPLLSSLLKTAGRRGLTPFPNMLPKYSQRLAEIAQEKYGIPLTAGQVSGSPSLRTMESTFTQLPFTANTQLDLYDAQRKAFTRAVMGKAGIQSDEATPEIIDDAFRHFGQRFDNLAARTEITLDRKMIDDINRIAEQYGRRLDANIKGSFKTYVDDLKKMQDTVLIDAMQGRPGTKVLIDGRAYQNASSDLKRAARAQNNNPDYKHALLSLARTLDDTLERSAGKALRKEWRETRNQYRNLLTINDAVTSGAAGEVVAGGIPFGGLTSAVKKMDKAGYGRGRGDLNELSRVGRFLADAIPPDSGTARRGHMTRMMTGGLPALAPLGAMSGGYIDPATAAAMSAVPFALPKAIKTTYRTPLVQGYVRNQLAQPTPSHFNSPLLAKVLTAQALGNEAGP